MAKTSAGGQFDTLTIKLPKGTKDRIKNLSGKNETAYITDLVLRYLEVLEKRQKSGPALFII